MRRNVASLICSAGDAWQQLQHDRRGVTAIEYGLVGALVFLAIVSGISGVGPKLTPVFATISHAL